MTPGAWLTSERVARAVDLLESTDLPLAGVADISGFGSLETFRRKFRDVRGTTPSQYRNSFGAEPT